MTNAQHIVSGIKLAEDLVKSASRKLGVPGVLKLSSARKGRSLQAKLDRFSDRVNVFTVGLRKKKFVKKFSESARNSAAADLFKASEVCGAIERFCNDGKRTKRFDESNKPHEGKPCEQ